MTLRPIIVVAVQPRVGADGGTASLGEIISRFQHHWAIVVADHESAQLAKWRKLGIEVHVIPQNASEGFRRNPVGSIRSYWRYRREIRRLILRSGAKIIHANDPLSFQLSLAPARETGAAIILNLRDTRDPDSTVPSTRYRMLFAAADHVFYLSADMAKRWSTIAPNAKRACSVTYSIVDQATFTPAPLPAKQPPVVLLSGLIRAKKGQLEFLRQVAPKLAEEGISTWLAGDFDPSADPYMAACAEAAAPLGDAVKFLGYRHDVAQLMGRATVVAVASRYEGLVRAMIEAMTCARPVVSFDISSAREILEQQSGGAGVVVEVGDYAGFAEAIIRYCRDPSLAREAGLRGQVTASRLFAPDEVVSRYEHVYDLLESDT